MLFCNIKDIFDVICDSQGRPLDNVHASDVLGEPPSSGTCNTSHVHATDDAGEMRPDITKVLEYS